MSQTSSPKQKTNSSPLETQRKREVDVLARTLYGEARGESRSGKEAVACVIMNRVKRAQSRGNYWWGNSVESVCQKPWQFSCWNENDPNLEKILAMTSGHRVFDTCLRIARRAISGCLDDATQGATHYHNLNINPPWSRGRPACVEIGHHLFYNDIE
ncbi:MAG: cell wall hydrolase [Magnetovibrio sp.]|nr:cell wall hydrolase [Magnetovibrio sp.]